LGIANNFILEREDKQNSPWSLRAGAAEWRITEGVIEALALPL